MNRFFLLSIPVLSLSVYAPLSPLNEQQGGVASVLLPAFDVSAYAVSNFNNTSLLWIVYLLGVIVRGSIVTFNSVKLYSKGKPIESNSNYPCFLISEGGSYSFFNRIFLTSEDLSNQLVLEHEEAHLNQKHSWDLLVVNIVTTLLWFNPIIWRWKVLIRQNHEYLADESVMNGSRKQSKEYIHLLLDRALDTNQFSLENYFSLNSLISKRITMLNKKKKQKLWKTAVLASFMLGSTIYISACNKTVENPPPPPPPAEEVQNNNYEKVYEKVDEMPEYKGGQQALYTYLGSNITYPEDCKENKIEGTVYASFIIDKNGKLTELVIKKGIHKSMDAEVIRVLSVMGDWKPGIKDGKPVKVQMTLPIKFAMPQEKM
tara:strand:+ start:26425 stop:27543 length:1119 start_codon:yes stop_codon:yes gene_type:complete